MKSVPRVFWICLISLLPAFCAADDAVDFERHIVPLLAKYGCNSGACHGSFDGRGGFRLSLFSYDPRADYLAITRGQQGRRINVLKPEESLLLRKPLLEVGHQGGRRFARDSQVARLLRAWIAEGAKHQPGSGRIERCWIEGIPSDLPSPSASVSFQVKVRFSDGSESDVTEFAELRTQDETIALVASPGALEVRGFGETVLIARYLGEVATRPILVPRPASKKSLPSPPAANNIDPLIDEKLAILGIFPSERSSDAEFLRRVTLHTIGSLPSSDEVRKFLTDTRPDKRGRKIDELLAHPLHAAMWASRFSVWTGNDLDLFPGDADLKACYAQLWQDWFRDRFARNIPYDEIVKGLLCATSRNGEDIADWIEREADLVRNIRSGDAPEYSRNPRFDLFWRRGGDDTFPAEDVAERLAAVLFGVRVECAKCHKHPFDRWTQNDYRAFANIFTQVRHGQSTELRIGILNALEARREQTTDRKPPPLPKLSEVYLTDRFQDFEDRATHEPIPPRPLGGPVLDSSGDRRRHLADWLTGDGKETLARAFVNRMWAVYFGRGLVEPLDDFSATNPPSHPELLDWLSKEFIESRFDIRHLERLLLNSETYQRSSVPNESNQNDQRNYSHAKVQTMPAATAVDVLHDALDVSIRWGDEAPPNRRAIEVGATRVRQELVNRMFGLFQRPARKTPCDCERASAGSVRQSLFLMSDDKVAKLMRSGRLKELLQSSLSDEAIIEELFLSSLSRFPTPEEQQASRQYIENSRDRIAGFEGVWWAILNTREFLTIH